MVRNKASNFRNFWKLAAVVAVISIAGIVAVRNSEKAKPASASSLVALASCLTEKGVKMYGAEWCSHCQKQKKAFGEASALIDYVECSVPNDPRQLAKECQEAGIDSFPTWRFSLGHQRLGELSFEELAEESGCPWEVENDTESIGITDLPEVVIDMDSIGIDASQVERVE